MTGTENSVAKTGEKTYEADDPSSYFEVPAYMSSSSRRLMMKEVVKTMPDDVQHRINGLKNLQKSYLEMEAKFFEEVFALECKYQQMYQPLVDRRKEIITGEASLTEGEDKWEEPEDAEEEEVDSELLKRFKQMALNYNKQHSKIIKESKGIPAFWLTVFKNTQTMADMIQSHDEPVLAHLTNVNIIYKTDPMSYVIEFHFSPNPYFTDAVLTKTYFMRCKVDTATPFIFEGPEIYRCTGCEIHWNSGKNVTVRTIKKQQKHKQSGQHRTLTKMVPNDSFFNFFNPPEVEGDEMDVDEETQMLLASDFEIGHFLRARIIPKAILYYTGEVMDEDDEGEEEEEEEEDEEDEEEGMEEEGEEEEEDDDDEEEERPVAAIKAKKPHRGGGGGGGKKQKGQNPAECPQQ